MRRLKSIDIFRGICMMWLFSGHILNWWLTMDDVWFYYLMLSLIDFIGAAGFIFVAGLSTAISYNNRKIKGQINEDYDEKMQRDEYFLRVLFISIIAMAYNIVYGWLATGNILNLWRWYVLMTISFSLIIAWPLLKTSRLFRIILGISLWIFNIYIIEFLIPHEGEYNVYGVLFYFLYHRLTDNYLLGFFTFFLMGTVIGDLIFEIVQIENKNERLSVLKKKMIFPSLILGPFFIIIGVIFKFPEFLTTRGSFSWLIYMLGIDVILITIFVSIEEFEIIKTEKSYKFLYYFSYYSLTLFVIHYPIAFLFYHKISLNYIIYFIVTTVIIVGLFMRFLHKRIEGRWTIFNWQLTFSLKVQIGRMSQNIVLKRANKVKNAQI